MGRAVIDAGSTVALDTMCFIYLFEAHPEFLPLVRPIFARVEGGDLVAVASTLALTETLAGPLRHGEVALAKRYRQVFRDFPNLRLVPVDEPVAVGAATLRARHGLRTPDAIHLASARHAGAEVFLTGDARLVDVAEVPVRLLGGKVG